MRLTPAQLQQLDADGFLILAEAMSPQLLDRLRRRVEELFAEEGEQAGAEFKQEAGCLRLANLVNKGAVFVELLTDARLLQGVRHVLGPEFKLSSLNARSALAATECRQPLHADMGAIADAQGFWVCNSIWLLDDFTAENGTIRVVPGSHRWRQLPQDVLEDPLAPHSGEQLVLAPAGSVIVMNAHLWHGATSNRTAAPRRAVHVFFTRRDKPQQQYQKALLSPETAQRLSPQVRELLALDDPLNDELCTGSDQASGFLR